MVQYYDANEAYELGKQYYEDGFPINFNPFPVESDKYLQFDAGWKRSFRNKMKFLVGE